MNIFGEATTKAEARTAIGVVAGGEGDIWVEKAGDTMTGPLKIGAGNDLRLSNPTDSEFASLALLSVGAVSINYPFRIINGQPLQLAKPDNSTVANLSFGADGVVDLNAALTLIPGTSITPDTNGQITIEFTNNTTLTFKGKGTDGVLRTGTLTLA